MAKLTLSKPKFNIFRTDFRNLAVLIRKELNLFFNNTLAYIVISVSILLHFFLFFITGAFFAANQSDLINYFNFLPWVFLILIPVLTMGSISNEEREGTIEFILSKPVGTIELILSKLISVFIIIVIVLAIEFLILIPILSWGIFDYGKILAQYIAAALLTLAFSSFGILVSSMTRSQISAFLITAVGIFFGLLIGIQNVAIYLPVALSKYLERMSILSHYTSMLRGAIEVGDLMYFIGAALLCTFAAYYVLMLRKLPKTSGKLTSLGIITLIGLVLVVLAVGAGQRIPGRFDLTEDKINTLTDVSKKLVSESEDDVKFQLYYTDSLPPQFQTVKRDFFNLIREYERASNGKLKVEYISTSSEDGVKRATEAGIQPLSFEEKGSLNVNYSVGYMGLVVEYKDKKEVIASVVETNNLEYEVSGLLKKLTVTEKKKVGILDTKVKHTTTSTLSVLKQLLENEFEVVSVVFDEENRKIADDINTLIIAGPNQDMSAAMQDEIKRYFHDGGAIMLLSDPATEDTYTLTTTETPGGSLSNFFEDIGITVEKKMIFDLQSFLSVNYQQSFLPVPYPFFPVALSTYKSPINSKIDGIGLRWAGWISINSDKAKDIEITELFTTSDYAGFKDITGTSINPDQNWNEIEQSSLEKLVTAVSILEKDDKPGRAVVISDADVLSDEGIASSQNGVFSLSSIEWLAQDQSLASIKAKERIASPLSLPFVQTAGDDGTKNINMASIVQFGGPFALVVLVVGTGFVKNRMRRKQMDKVYVVGS